MNRYIKLITLASVGSALSVTPALAATGRAPAIESPSGRVHHLAFGSPRTVAIDVPAVATPALSTPSARTPSPGSCVHVQSISLPAAVQVRSGKLPHDVNSPSATGDAGTCLTVPSVSVGSIPVASKRADVEPITVAVPASVAMDDSGAESSAGDGMAVAKADGADRYAGLDITTGAGDINVDVAPHL